MGNAAGITVARISVMVTPVTKEFSKKLKEELEEIERTIKGDVHIQAHLDSAQARADFERMKLQMERNKVKLHVETVHDKGRDKLPDLNLPSGSSRVSNKGFDPSSLLPSFGSGINPAGYVAIAGLLTTVVAPAVGLVTTGLLAMPGLFSALLAPIGAVALGMDGIKAAAEASGLFHDSKPGKKGGGGAGGAFGELKAAVNSTFKAELIPAFDALAELLGNDAFVGGMKNVASGFSTIATSIGKAVSEGPGLAAINNTVAKIGQAMTAAAPGWGSFTTAIAELASGLADKLPDLSAWFNKSMAGFDEWVKKINTGGDKSQFSIAMDQLGHTADEVFSKIADWGKRAFEFMATPGSMNGFIETIDKIGDAITKLIDLSARFNESWQAVVQAGRFTNVIWDFLSAGPKALGDLFNGFDTHNGADAMQGMISNFRDLKDNKSWLGDATGAGTKAQVDALTKSAQEAGNAASDAQGKLQSLVGEGAPQSLKGAVLPGGHGAGGGASVVAPEPKTQIEPPDTTAAMTAINKYKDDVTTVISGIKTALDDVGQVKAPDLSGFAASFDGMADVARGAMSSVVSEIESGGNTAAVAAVNVGTQVADGFRSISAAMAGVGMDIDNGLALGINAGQSVVIQAAVNVATAALKAAKGALDSHSPSRKFMELGGDVTDGLAIGMENGIQPVIDQAKGLAAKVADAFANGSDPSVALQGYSQKDINGMESTLSQQSKMLRHQASALDYQAKQAGKGPLADQLKARADDIRMQKEGLDLQKEMLDLTDELNGKAGSGKSSGNVFLDAINELMKVPNALGGATMNQAMQDLGISGNGALEAIGGLGMDMLNKGVTNIFNTSNVDDTISLHNNQTNRQAQSYTGR